MFLLNSHGYHGKMVRSRILYKGVALMSYKINFEVYANSFVLPQAVIDDDFDSLNPIYLKVIMLIFRHSYKHYSESLIANLLKLSEREVSEAIAFWSTKGILAITVQQHTEAVVLPQPQPVAVHDKRELSFLLQCMEGLLQRPVTAVEQKSVIHILEYIKLPADVVLMAIDYCVTAGKMNARYLEKLCSSWADKGITSHDVAEKYLAMIKQSKQREQQIKQMLGIDNRALTDSENAAMIRWINEYKFTNEMIKLAFEKTVAATGKVAFPYMNKILSNWHELGYTTIETVSGGQAVERRDASYDIDELDRFWDNVPKLD